MKPDRESLTADIIGREWQMFTRVPNEGGRAACQDDRRTFEIMRKSQFAIWSEDALEAYRKDLGKARMEGRNLMTEKYGYMMADTAPEAFEQIRKRLPDITKEKQKFVDDLVEIQLGWMAEFQKRFPGYGSLGRPLYKKDANLGETSLETYTTGEMLTYSVETLQLLKDCFHRLEQDRVNGGLCIMEETARRYGYRSLEEVERSCRKPEGGKSSENK